MWRTEPYNSSYDKMVRIVANNWLKKYLSPVFHHLYRWPMLYKENVGHTEAWKHPNVRPIFNCKAHLWFSIDKSIFLHSSLRWQLLQCTWMSANKCPQRWNDLTKVTQSWNCLSWSWLYHPDTSTGHTAPVFPRATLLQAGGNGPILHMRWLRVTEFSVLSKTAFKISG